MGRQVGFALVCSLFLGCAGKQPVDPTSVSLEIAAVPAEYSEFEKDLLDKLHVLLSAILSL